MSDVIKLECEGKVCGLMVLMGASDAGEQWRWLVYHPDDEAQHEIGNAYGRDEAFEAARQAALRLGMDVAAGRNT